MATREENIKKINTELEKLTDEELDQVVGGSWYITEEQAKKSGLTLKKEDGSPGSFGYLWNTGDYYWNGEKLSPSDACHVIYFVKCNGRQPSSIKEANEYYADDRDDDVGFELAI
ncbi:MAG: bacteriocin [Selenomonadaceae bacterium]|nr:bacteriocin [Selenomonadaceae bacterium]